MFYKIFNILRKYKCLWYAEYEIQAGFETMAYNICHSF
ncbi:hypothetical protein TW90_1366 [Neisseria flavescens]|nr:hypothetical protein TW90_1366 [Neisseria flavescens]